MRPTNPAAQQYVFGVKRSSIALTKKLGSIDYAAFMMGLSGQPANGFHTEASSNTNPATGPSPAMDETPVSVSTPPSCR